jgi:hypothetical protein
MMWSADSSQLAVRGTERCLDHAHTRRLEQLTNRNTPLPIAVADHDAVAVEHALVRSGELAYDLAYEGLVWMRRGADDRDASGVQFDHKQRVIGDQAANGPDFRCEEVRGHHRVPMRPQECLPRSGPLGGIPCALRIVAIVERATR